MSMIERVARAICAAQDEDSFGLYDYSSYPGVKPPHVVVDEINRKVVFRSEHRADAESKWRLLRRAHVARAAIEAMLEPTKEMEDIGYQAFCGSGRPRGLRFIDAYTAMIDAALKPERKKTPPTEVRGAAPEGPEPIP